MAGWRIGAGAEYGEELERNGEDSELGCATVDKLDADRSNYGSLVLGKVRACTTHRHVFVSKRLESIIQTDIKTCHTTHRQGVCL